MSLANARVAKFYRLDARFNDPSEDPEIDYLLTEAISIRYEWTLPALRRAIDCLERILRIEPNHPQALAGLAELYTTPFGQDPRIYLKLAEEHVKTCFVVAPDTWLTHFVDGTVKAAVHWDWERAGKAFERAVRLSHGEAQYHEWYTSFLASQGKIKSAIEILRPRARYSEDRGLIKHLALMQILYGDFKGAERTLDRLLKTAQDND